MIIENKLKGIFILILSIMYLVLLCIRLFPESGNLNKEVAMLYLMLDLSLLITSLYIFAKKQTIKMYLNLVIVVTSLMLSTVIIYSTDSIKSEYFPVLYLSLIMFAALNKGRKFLYLTTFLVLSLILLTVLLSPYQLEPAQKLTFLLYLIVFSVIIMVIRNYPFECLDCNKQNEACPYKNTCPINAKGKARGELSAIKLYKES